jgi:hypothetical protein
MKKLLILLAFTSALAACHYGVEEADKTLKANDEYKSGAGSEYSTNRGNDGVLPNNETAVPADTAASVADTTKK